MSRAGADEARDFDALWAYDDPAGTEAKFRETLPAAREAGEVTYVAELLSQIGRALGLQRKFDDSHDVLDQAGALLATSDVGGRAADVARVRLFLERGRAINSGGEPKRAEPLFRSAWDLAVEIGHDFHAIDAAHMLEIVSTGEKKLAWNQDATELAERSSDERARKWLSSLYNNRGFSLHELERFDEALAVFRKRLAHLEKIGGPDEQRRITRWSIGKTLRLLGRPDEGLAIQENLLAASEQPDGDAYTHEEIAECLHALGRDGEARPHFAVAHRVASEDPWQSANEPERISRLARLAEGAAG